MPKVIGIIGTRSRDSIEDLVDVEQVFLEHYQEGDVICSGLCAQGGDRFAVMLHEKYETACKWFPPDWKRLGRAAPFIRNSQIAEESDIIIACVRNPEDGIDRVLRRKTGGTEDTLKKFYKDNGKKNIFLV